MKNIYKLIGLGVIAFGLLFSACDDMLDTDSAHNISTEDNKLTNSNESFYSVMGILKQVQAIGNRYVILGELRGDLMDVTANSDINLQDIYNFTATADNPYISINDYYAVINNCNFFLQNVDTTYIEAGTKPLLSEYAAVKGIRAWTYMQIALNFGEATYYEDPILSVADANKDYPKYNINALSSVLIQDLLPYINIATPDYGSVGSWLSSPMFIPLILVIGDLALWQQNYELAATAYFAYLNAHELRPVYYSNYMTSMTGSSSSWGDIFRYSHPNSIISYIAYSNEYEVHSNMYWLAYPTLWGENNSIVEYKIAPSKPAMENWLTQKYVYYDEDTDYVTYLEEDMRGKPRFGRAISEVTRSTSYCWSQSSQTDSVPVISKIVALGSFLSTIPTYRTTTAYLRYAEALNNAGMPSVAFAVLKYGIRSSILSDPEIINQEEVNPLPAYVNFGYLASATDTEQERLYMGIRRMGSGDIDKDTLYYIFPNDPVLPTKADSMKFVDELILLEYALETAFEGNRFHDLMRFATRYNDPRILAERVGRKNPSVQSLLMDPKNWYLPSK